VVVELAFGSGPVARDGAASLPPRPRLWRRPRTCCSRPVRPSRF